MGGFGSGNIWRFGTKATCEQMLKVDLRYMQKKGFLVSGFHGRLSWNCGGEPSGNITFKAHKAGIYLIYKVREIDDEWVNVTEYVPFQYSFQHFGGQRKWFTCLSCQRKCLVLYGGRLFRCRKCYNLAYQCQNEDQRDRIDRRARKIREKLGGSTDIFDFFPKKPKGMHWKTYNALARKGERLEEALEAELALMMRHFY